VAGPKTNAAFLHALITHPTFERAQMDTGFIARGVGSLAPGRSTLRPSPLASGKCWGGCRKGRCRLALERGDGFQLGAPRRQKLTILVDGEATKLDVRWNESGPDVSLSVTTLQRHRNCTRWQHGSRRGWALRALQHAADRAALADA